MGRRVAGRGEVTLQMNGNYGVPLGFVHVDEHPVAEDPRVVDEDVQPPERIERALNHSSCSLEVGDVLRIGDGLSACGRDLRDDIGGGRALLGLAGERRAEVVDDDTGAGRGERESVRATEATPCPSDDGGLSVEEWHLARSFRSGWPCRARRHSTS